MAAGGEKVGNSRGRSSAMKSVAIGFLKLYRLLVSPLYGDVCRYYPSCSAYALEAVEVHGAVRGGGLSVRRLSRCHPWNLGGYDPVPGTPAAKEWADEQLSKTRNSDEGTKITEINSAPTNGHTTRCMS